MRAPAAFRTFGFLAVAAILTGCQDGRPISPSAIATADLEIPINDSIGAALLSSESTEILYAVRDKGGLKKKGKIGPFQGEAVPTGSLNLSFQVAVGPEAVLSLQVNNADTKQPLALGATYLNLLGGGVRSPQASAVGYKGKTNVPIDLGSLLGSCSSFGLMYPGEYISFSIGQYSGSPTGYDDVYFNSWYENDVWMGDYFDAYPFGSDRVAYLGNGDLVDFAYVPPSSGFHPSSREAKQGQGSPYLQVGDVYCVMLNYDGGYAWVQVAEVDNNDGTRYSFRYRTNSSVPFYAWQFSSCYNW